jgi:hypothetical protein
MGVGVNVEFRGVKVVRESDLALCCHIRGRDYWIGREHLLNGSTVAHFADWGTVLVTRQFAEARGLLRDRSRPLL